MTEYTIVRNIDGEEHTTRIKANSRLQAIETVQKSDEYSFPAKRRTLIDCEDMDDERVVE